MYRRLDYTKSMVFDVLACFGLWKPVKYSDSKLFKYFYPVVTFLNFFSYYSYNYLQMFWLVLECDNADDFNEQFLYAFLFWSCTLKMNSIVLNRKNILKLEKLSYDTIFVLLTDEEENVYKKCDDRIR